jgi:hypothetical protein
MIYIFVGLNKQLFFFFQFHKVNFCCFHKNYGIIKIRSPIKILLKKNYNEIFINNSHNNNFIQNNNYM